MENFLKKKLYKTLKTPHDGYSILIHLFACSALLTSLERSAALICSLACSGAHGIEDHIYELNMFYMFYMFHRVSTHCTMYTPPSCAKAKRAFSSVGLSVTKLHSRISDKSMIYVCSANSSSG